MCLEAAIRAYMFAILLLISLGSLWIAHGMWQTELHYATEDCIMRQITEITICEEKSAPWLPWHEPAVVAAYYPWPIRPTS